MAWTYEQLFNGLTDGNLNGQDSWSATDESPVLNVVTDQTFEGAKAIKTVFSAGGLENDYRRSITAISEGSMYFAFRQSANNLGNNAVILRVDAGGNIMFVQLPGVLPGDAVKIITDVSSVTVDTGFSANTWYVVNVEFDDANQDNKYRARVWKPGTGWGAFCAWSNTQAAYTTIDQIRILGSSADGGGAHDFWIDTITGTDPTGGSAATVSPTLLLMGVG